MDEREFVRILISRIANFDKDLEEIDYPRIEELAWLLLKVIQDSRNVLRK
jgi:hypothetical protein